MVKLFTLKEITSFKLLFLIKIIYLKIRNSKAHLCWPDLGEGDSSINLICLVYISSISLLLGFAFFVQLLSAVYLSLSYIQPLLPCFFFFFTKDKHFLCVNIYTTSLPFLSVHVTYPTSLWPSDLMDE